MPENRVVVISPCVPEILNSDTKQRAYSGGQGHGEGTPKGHSRGSREHGGSADLCSQGTQEGEKQE